MSQKLRANCMLSVEAPCARRCSFRSTYAALIMRSGSKPECWKKRLSSAETTAFTRSLGRSAKLTIRRFSRDAVEQVGDQLRLDQILGSFRVVAKRDDLRDLVALELDDSFFVVEVASPRPGKISIASGRRLYQPIRLVVFGPE